MFYGFGKVQIWSGVLSVLSIALTQAPVYKSFSMGRNPKLDRAWLKTTVALTVEQKSAT